GGYPRPRITLDGPGRSAHGRTRHPRGSHAVTGGERWVRQRLASAPPRLTEAMTTGAWEPGDSVAEELALRATALYETVVESSGGREGALARLAADALFTHAFQALAETDPEAIPAFAARWGGGRLGRLARDSGEGSG